MIGAEPGMVWRRHPRSISRSVPDGWLALAHDAETPALLSGTAASVWELIEHPEPLERIVAEATRAYAGDHAQIRADITTALDALARGHLAEAIAGDGPGADPATEP